METVFFFFFFRQERFGEAIFFLNSLEGEIKCLKNIFGITAVDI